MIDPDFITESENLFKSFMKLPLIEASYDSGLIMFDHDFLTPYPETLFYSHFRFKDRPICVPSEKSYKKGQKICPTWSCCDNSQEADLLFATGLTTYVPELGEWVPLGIFESGTPVLLASPIAEESE